MKRLLSIILIFSMLALALPAGAVDEEDLPNFTGMNDPTLLPFVEDALYGNLITALDGEDYVIEDISTVYISQEYLDELSYNSQANIYFGYTLEELNAQFEGTRYVFTLGADNETTVVPFEAYEDNTYQKVLKNVALGAGVILVCVTVSAATYTAAPSVSIIFACAAKTGTTMALKSGAMGFVSAGILRYMQTGNMEEALKAGLTRGSEAFKWGAIGGTVSGAAAETSVLSKWHNLTNISWNDAAKIQREGRFSLDFIRNISSMEEYEAYKNADLREYRLRNGESVLLPDDFDFDFADPKTNKTNLQLLIEGYNPVDANGVKYEWHHVNQRVDSPLALLTNAQHHGNHAVLHSKTVSTVHTPENGSDWNRIRRLLNKYVASARSIFVQ